MKSWPFPGCCKPHAFWGTCYLPAPAVSLATSSDYYRPLVEPLDEFQPERETGPTPLVPVIFSGSPGIAYDFGRKWYDSRFRDW